MNRLSFLVASFSSCLCSISANAAPLPLQVGQCSTTTVARVETRLLDGQTHKPISGSGSAIVFTNGGYQVSYDTIAAVEQSRPGDKVKLCLVKIPADCPPEDHRGKIYYTLNYRTGKSWTLPDAEHSCGGA